MMEPTKVKLPLGPSIHPSAGPILAGEIEPLLRGYLQVVEGFAQRHSIPISKVEISGFQDPEEGSQQLVVAIWMRLPTKDAMERWHAMGRALENWVNGLPELEAETVAEWIAMEVYSDVEEVTTPWRMLAIENG